MRLIEPPGTSRLECTPDRFGDGWSLGWETATENEFEFTVEPGLSEHIVRAYCKVFP